MKNMTTSQIEAKRDKLYRLLSDRHSTRRAMAIRNAYDRCVTELIRRGFEDARASRDGVTS